MESIRAKRPFVVPGGLRRPAAGIECAVALFVAAAFSLSPVLAQEPAARFVGDSKIRVEAFEVDLGTVARGEVAEARFVVHNEGERSLRILRVKPG